MGAFLISGFAALPRPKAAQMRLSSLRVFDLASGDYAKHTLEFAALAELQAGCGGLVSCSRPR